MTNGFQNDGRSAQILYLGKSSNTRLWKYPITSKRHAKKIQVHKYMYNIIEVVVTSITTNAYCYIFTVVLGKGEADLKYFIYCWVNYFMCKRVLNSLVSVINKRLYISYF